MRTVTLLLTASLKHADGQGSHGLGSGPHAAPSAAAGDVGRSLSRLQVPEAQVFIGHLAHVQSAHREPKGTVSRALMSHGRGGVVWSTGMRLTGARARLACVQMLAGIFPNFSEP